MQRSGHSTYDDGIHPSCFVEDPSLSKLLRDRPYTSADVERLRGIVLAEHTLARRGVERLRAALEENAPVAALGCLTGNQAVQAVKAGLKAIYLSGWQVAADANVAGQMYLDQSLYPANSVPDVVRRINNALSGADQIDHLEAAPQPTGSRRSWPTWRRASAARSRCTSSPKP